jgi:hypothetical protein
MYIIVFKDIDETKSRHQYASHVVIFTDDLKNIYIFLEIFFDGVLSIMSQQPSALIHFFQFCVQ